MDPKGYRYLNNDFLDYEMAYYGKLGYTKDAYAAMAKYLFSESMTPAQAYRAMGFDPDALGEDKAEELAEKARRLYEKDPEFTKKKENYNGMIPLEKMPELTQEEQDAFMAALTAFGENFIEERRKYDKIMERREL